VTGPLPRVPVTGPLRRASRATRGVQRLP